MKILKKLGIFMVCAMLATSLVPEAAKASKTDIVVEAENASAAFGEKYEEEYAHNSKYDNPLPAFYDINQDGIDEMFIYYDKQPYHTVEVFYYDHSGTYGKVVRAKKFTKCDSIRYSKAKKKISVVCAASDTEITRTVYSFTGKKLKKTCVYCLERKGYSIKFYKNGKRISTNKYNKASLRLSKWKNIEKLLEHWY